jgi:hypothetical protein
VFPDLHRENAICGMKLKIINWLLSFLNGHKFYCIHLNGGYKNCWSLLDELFGELEAFKSMLWLQVG